MNLRKCAGNFLRKCRKTKNMLLVKISPELSARVNYKKLFGKPMNMNNPQTFAEKIQWLKLYHHDEKIVLCADKFLVREYVKERIDEKHLINMPFVWDSHKDINFDELPKSFVLKPNNSSGSVLICKDKNELNIKEAIKKIKKWEKENIGKYTGEWVYSKIPFKIVCEEYLEDEIVDYKFYFANGEFICVQTISGRSAGKKQFGYYDENWSLLDIRRFGVAAVTTPEEKPEKYDEMLEIAQGFVFVRVDLYCVEKKVYFGELSFYPNNGLLRYQTAEMDKLFSEKVILPLK